MAIGWLTVLKTVPWTDVISNAPAVANGAKKLWKSVNKKTAPQDLATGEQDIPGTQPEAQARDVLQDRLDATENAINELHEQMLVSSELITTLAEQNNQLIKRAETMRVRTLWLAASLLVIGIAAAVALVLVWPLTRAVA
jgi:hypothetical protein